MRSNIRYGKIPEPKSLAEAVARRSQLWKEVERIPAQLADSKYALNKTEEEYAKWTEGARWALKMFTDELRLVEEWILRKEDVIFAEMEERHHLRRAHSLLVLLRDEGVDFDADEVSFIDELDSCYGTEENAVAKSG